MSMQRISMSQNEKELFQFIITCLSDENGVSELAYVYLVKVTKDTPPFSVEFTEKFDRMLQHVDATDGRFYLSEGWK